MIPTWIIEWVANAEGISEADLKTIETAIPAMQDMLVVVQQAMPLVNKALPLIKELSPAAQIILAALAKHRGTTNGSTSTGTTAGGAIG